MRVTVGFTPAERPSAPVGIVIDVLRATSTICQALAAGWSQVVCVGEVEHARALAGPGVALAGERHNLRIDGFDFGNSPRELLDAPPGETLVLTTTNGTRLLVAAAARFEQDFVGSLLNLDAVADAARRGGGDVAVLCAGVLGELALDDAYCAGRIVAALGGDNEDSAEAAVRLAASFPDALAGLGASRSARNLRRHGLEADIDWCARENALDVVPRFVRTVGAAAEVSL